MKKKYDNIFCYNYNLVIPKVGNDSEVAAKKKENNTIATYYNWVLSKATKRYFVKWDGDFIGQSNNFKNLIDLYNLKNNTKNLTIWFKGLTIFYNKYINLNSWYDEFRIFTNSPEAKWENYGSCESIINYAFKADEIYIYPFKKNIKNYNNNEEILKMKNNSGPIFLNLNLQRLKKRRKYY